MEVQERGASGCRGVLQACGAVPEASRAAGQALRGNHPRYIQFLLVLKYFTYLNFF